MDHGKRDARTTWSVYSLVSVVDPYIFNSLHTCAYRDNSAEAKLPSLHSLLPNIRSAQSLIALTEYFICPSIGSFFAHSRPLSSLPIIPNPFFPHQHPVSQVKNEFSRSQVFYNSIQVMIISHYMCSPFLSATFLTNRTPVLCGHHVEFSRGVTFPMVSPRTRRRILLNERLKLNR